MSKLVQEVGEPQFNQRLIYDSLNEQISESEILSCLSDYQYKECKLVDESECKKCVCIKKSDDKGDSQCDEFKPTQFKRQLQDYISKNFVILEYLCQKQSNFWKRYGDKVEDIKIDLNEVQKEKVQEKVDLCEKEKEEKLGFFEKYLILWVAICMAIGIGLSQGAEDGAKEIKSWHKRDISIPIGVCLFFMMYPSLIDLQPKRILYTLKYPKPIFTALLGNWIIAPFVAWCAAMAILGGDKELILATILLGSSPCTAMVIVWGRLAGADQEQNFINTTLNTILMIFLYAPIVQLYSGASDFSVDWIGLVLTVAIFIGSPIFLGMVSRQIIIKIKGQIWLEKVYKPLLSHISTVALLATLIILFWMNGKLMTDYPKDLLLMSAVLLVQFPIMIIINFTIARYAKLQYQSAATSIIIASSSNFEIALATAITLRGANSKAALGTTLGIFWEVPVMLLLVWIIKYFGKTKNIFTYTEN